MPSSVRFVVLCMLSSIVLVGCKEEHKEPEVPKIVAQGRPISTGLFSRNIDQLIEGKPVSRQHKDALWQLADAIEAVLDTHDQPDTLEQALDELDAAQLCMSHHFGKKRYQSYAHEIIQVCLRRPADRDFFNETLGEDRLAVLQEPAGKGNRQSCL